MGNSAASIDVVRPLDDSPVFAVAFGADPQTFVISCGFWTTFGEAGTLPLRRRRRRCPRSDLPMAMGVAAWAHDRRPQGMGRDRDRKRGRLVIPAGKKTFGSPGRGRPSRACARADSTARWGSRVATETSVITGIPSGPTTRDLQTESPPSATVSAAQRAVPESGVTTSTTKGHRYRARALMAYIGHVKCFSWST